MASTNGSNDNISSGLLREDTSNNNLPLLNIKDEMTWSGNFTFIHASDPQLGFIEKFIMKKKIPRWEEEKFRVSKAIEFINQISPKPRFFVIGGDMVDECPFPSTLKLHNEQRADFLKLFSQLDSEIPLIFVPGNHDVGDIPTPETIKIYRDEYGMDFYYFWIGGVKFSVLNSQYFKSPESVPEEAKRHDDFINTIYEPDVTHSVVFQHYPFFIADAEEEDVPFLNIERHIRMPTLERLEIAGVKYIFCGHWHRNGGGEYNGIQQIVTAALGGTFDGVPSGFRIVHVEEDKIYHEYIATPI